MSKTLYSSNKLSQIKQDIQNLLNGAEDLSTKASYAFAKNRKRINDEIELVKGKLKENPKEFQEYNQAVFDALKNNGATTKINPNGREFVQSTADLDKQAYDKEIKKIEKKFKETIEEVEEVNEHNQKILNDEVIDIDFYAVKYSELPDSGIGKFLTDNILLLIEEDVE